MTTTALPVIAELAAFADRSSWDRAFDEYSSKLSAYAAGLPVTTPCPSWCGGQHCSRWWPVGVGGDAEFHRVHSTSPVIDGVTIDQYEYLTPDGTVQPETATIEVERAEDTSFTAAEACALAAEVLRLAEILETWQATK